MAILKAGAVVLPCPVSMIVNDEIIWSANTGRTTSGEMVGDVIAEKKTIEINWGILTEDEMRLIKSNLRAGFFPISFRDDGVDLTISSYRGTLVKQILGTLSDGITYYKNATVTLIQQ